MQTIIMQLTRLPAETLWLHLLLCHLISTGIKATMAHQLYEYIFIRHRHLQCQTRLDHHPKSPSNPSHCYCYNSRFCHCCRHWLSQLLDCCHLHSSCHRPCNPSDHCYHPRSRLYCCCHSSAASTIHLALLFM